MNKIAVYAVAAVFIMVPFLLIGVSHGKIISNILKPRSARGRAKAFSTCSSHRTVVVLFYSTASTTYLQPKPNQSEETGKLISLFYTVWIPMLNPIIFTLRNKDITVALRKLLSKLSNLTRRLEITEAICFYVSHVNTSENINLVYFYVPIN